ncbi:hypothetical protein [Enterococcus hirae]|uniref:hypothetical protein n=1 Tax=Enterococcus hirae TaxID=1354 RepID=UPI00391CC28B
MNTTKKQTEFFYETFREFKDQTLGDFAFIESLIKENIRKDTVVSNSALLDDTHNELMKQIDKSFKKLSKQCSTERVESLRAIHQKVKHEFMLVIDPLKETLIEKLKKYELDSAESGK